MTLGGLIILGDSAYRTFSKHRQVVPPAKVSDLHRPKQVYKGPGGGWFAALWREFRRAQGVDNFRNFTNPVVIYPNPATEVINIRMLNEKPGRSEINVYDMNGKRVIAPITVNKPAGAYSVAVTVSQLLPGSYVVQISTFGYKKIAATFIKM